MRESDVGKAMGELRVRRVKVHTTCLTRSPPSGCVADIAAIFLWWQSGNLSLLGLDNRISVSSEKTVNQS